MTTKVPLPLRLQTGAAGRPYNVVLVRPATITTAEAVGEDAAPPLGLAYLAACLRECGHEVAVVDGLGEALDAYAPIEGLATGMRHGLSDEEIVARIDPRAEIIGVSIMFSLEWPFSRELVKRIRARFPRAFLVAGGEHATALPEYSLGDCPALDCCVLGEGEQTLIDLVEARGRGSDLREVNGLCLRVPGGYLRTESRKRLRELGSLPRPAWDLVPIDAYLDAGVMTGVNFGRSMPMLASRGCPYRCTFCSNPVMWGTTWRVREPREVFAEMCDYADRLGATNFDFYDLTAIVRRDWIVEFCELIIASGRQFTWQLPSGTRSEAIDEEVTRLLYRSGCRYVNYAPESGSEVTLDRIKKRISKANMLASMRWAVGNGINVKANFILGFPGERLRQVWQTYRFVLAMSWVGIHDVSVFPFSPYPGSELFEFVRARGDVTLGEEYFLSLSQYTDPRYTRSYCEHLSPFVLRLLCLVAMALFYGLSYVRRPGRFFRLVRNVFFRKDGKTKLETVLVRVRKKREQLAGGAARPAKRAA
jgi:anaerobic magnesium-protoporphyrin IX monomethyl ester cyclase